MRRVNGFPEMTEEQKKRISTLKDRPEDQIDTSEIPEWTEKDFNKAVLFTKLYKPRKEQITARLDADILIWLKSHGRGYQTLMNNLLRKEMLEEKKKQA
jgi:uncharacterized protein (DUF4415 family)